jgi:hypothetical protein
MTELASSMLLRLMKCLRIAFAMANKTSTGRVCTV